MVESSLSARPNEIQLLPGIRPSLLLRMEIQIPTKLGEEALGTLNLTNFVGTLSVRGKEQERGLGPMIPERPNIWTLGGRPVSVSFSVWLDLPSLERLERERQIQQGHLHFRVYQDSLRATGWLETASRRVSGPHDISVHLSGEYRYVRDDWLAALGGIGYRRFRVYEAPATEIPEDWDIIPHLDKAWEVLQLGNPDDAMQECRKALEGLKAALKPQGFVKGKRIDFQALAQSETLGDTLNKIYTAAIGFQTPGQHHGKAIRYRDGEFAVLLTHALSSYVSRLVSMND